MLFNRLAVFAVCFLFIGTICAFSQLVDTSANRHKYRIVEYSGHSGRQLKTYTTLPESRFTLMNELRLAIQTDGSKVWHEQYGYPQVGVSILVGLLGNPDVFGQNISIVPNITFNTRKINNWCFQPTFGMGVSYFFKPNDPINNPDNLMIGSHITNISYANLFLRRKLTSQLYLKTGISYFHFSNGHYKLPNIGMNIPSVTLGLIYHSYSQYPSINGIKPQDKPWDQNSDRSIKLNFRLGIGVQEFGTATGPIGEEKYPVYIISVYLSKRYGKVSNVHMGLNATFYQRFYDYFKENNLYESMEFEKSSVLTFILAHEFLAGHIGFVSQGGINFYSPQHNLYFRLSDRWMTLNSFLKSYVSTKIGVQYYFYDTQKRISNNLSLGLYLKANFGQADFIETSINYTF